MSESHRPDRERGSSMVLAIFVLFLLTAMGIALLTLGEGEVKMSAAGLNVKTAYYLAEAGIEDGRATLLDTWGNQGFGGALDAARGVNDDFDFDPATVRPVYGTGGVVTGFTGYGDDQPLQAFGALGDGYYAAFLTNDPDEGRTTKTDGDSRVLVIGVGAGPNGSFEVAEAIIVTRAALPSTVPAAITMLGPMPSFGDAHSSSKRYVGDDCDGAGTPGLYAPVVGVIDDAAEANAELGVNANPTYESGGNVDADVVANLNDATEDTVAGLGEGTLDPAWTSCQNMIDMIEDIRLVADVVCDGVSPCVFPPSAPDRVVFVDGDIDVDTGMDGEGMLVVTGHMRLLGTASWNGAILVVGEGWFSREGGGSGDVSGAMVVADVAGPDGDYGTADDCTGGTDGFGQAVYDESGGGNGDTIYCSTEINASIPVTHYPVVDFRQW